MWAFTFEALVSSTLTSLSIGRKVQEKGEEEELLLAEEEMMKSGKAFPLHFHRKTLFSTTSFREHVHVQVRVYESRMSVLSNKAFLLSSSQDIKTFCHLKLHNLIIILIWSNHQKILFLKSQHQMEHQRSYTKNQLKKEFIKVKLMSTKNCFIDQ